MKNISVRQWVNFVAIILTIIINGLANSLPINNQTTGEISDRFNVFFVPAGYVFSIWGLIYLGLITYSVYQLLPSQRENDRLVKIGYLPAIASVANIGWLLLWHYEYFGLTMIAMVTLLLALIAIYVVLNIGRPKVSAREVWMVNIPFSIYLGWITVATIANATSLLNYLNWGMWGINPEIWTVIMLTVGVLVAVVMAITRGDIAYLLVLIWAFSGIAVKFPENNTVSTAAWIASVIVGLLVILALFRNQRYFQGAKDAS